MIGLKGDHIKRFAGVLFLLGIAVTFAACDGFVSKRVPYTFDNKSSREITVTLSSEYYTRDPTDSYVASKTKELSLYSGSLTEIFAESSVLDFSWTADSESYNRSIYCVVNGGKATFRNR